MKGSAVNSLRLTFEEKIRKGPGRLIGLTFEEKIGKCKGRVACSV